MLVVRGHWEGARPARGGALDGRVGGATDGLPQCFGPWSTEREESCGLRGIVMEGEGALHAHLFGDGNGFPGLLN
eukprot:9873226-Alexandrium_andersonii.AAC.1